MVLNSHPSVTSSWGKWYPESHLQSCAANLLLILSYLSLVLQIFHQLASIKFVSFVNFKIAVSIKTSKVMICHRHYLLLYFYTGLSVFCKNSEF